MKIFLASLTSRLDCILNKEDIKGIYALESFYYADKRIEKYIPLMKDFLLDSGAFTFFSSGKTVNWEEYVDKYADFINRNNVKHFFELDIDKLIGYENVLKLRKRLELETGKQCIPVWHKPRGKEEFLKMCDEYKYVALGGIASKEISTQQYSVFPYLINEAHKRGAKIHGLGFTSLNGIQKYKFDTVDSTSWLSGDRFGCLYKFNGKTLEKIPKRPGKRLKDYKQITKYNFLEWKKFQQYADKYL